MSTAISRIESELREQITHALTSDSCPPELVDLFTTFLVTGTCNPRSLLMARTGGGPINDLRWDLFRFLTYTES
jgi:hypothetical protein